MYVRMCKLCMYVRENYVIMHTCVLIYLYCYILGFRESMTYAFYCISMVT
jgi:hypothetical protein